MPKQTSVFMSFSSTKSVFCSPRVLSPSSLCLLSPPVTPKTSLERSSSCPAYKNIVSELYLRGQPLVAERIFSLLNPADLCSSLQVCTTWNHQVSCGAQFMNKISTYRRQCKGNAENLHKPEEPIETMVSPNKRRPLADFTPNTQTQFQTAKPACPVSSFTGMCIKPWHEGKNSGTVNLSKRPRQSEAICGTKKSKKRLRRL